MSVSAIDLLFEICEEPLRFLGEVLHIAVGANITKGPVLAATFRF